LSSYDAIAELYDPWSASVVEDVAFYLEEARRSGGPVVELGVGTGRIAVPIAANGIRMIGIDSSRGMLEVCARRAALAGVQLDLRVGDLREPPVSASVPLVICPFRSLLHMHTDADRRRVLRAAHSLLEPGGRFVFDVFAPDAADIEQTQARWLEREPGIHEHAIWDETARTLTLTVRGHGTETTMALAWLSPTEWRTLLEATGFEIEACYGWFDRTPYTGQEDTVWIARRPSSSALREPKRVE
jgi:SAM-dependent methyltransferase